MFKQFFFQTFDQRRQSSKKTMTLYEQLPIQYGLKTFPSENSIFKRKLSERPCRSGILCLSVLVEYEKRIMNYYLTAWLPIRWIKICIYLWDIKIFCLGVMLVSTVSGRKLFRSLSLFKFVEYYIVKRLKVLKSEVILCCVSNLVYFYLVFLFVRWTFKSRKLKIITHFKPMNFYTNNNSLHIHILIVKKH